MKVFFRLVVHIDIPKSSRIIEISGIVAVSLLLVVALFCLEARVVQQDFLDEVLGLNLLRLTEERLAQTRD